MPPDNLKSTWSYERYNAAMMEALAEEPEWVAYKRALAAARASSGRDVALPAYPEEVVRDVQQRVNEAATAEMLSQLESLRVAETGMLAAPSKRAVGAGAGAGAGASASAEAKRRDVAQAAVDPDFLISAFSTKFTEVWSDVSATILALHANDELNATMERAITLASPYKEAALTNAANAASTIYASKSAAFDRERARVSSSVLEAEKARELLSAEQEREDTKRKIVQCQTTYEKIQNGIVENGRLKRMGIVDLRAEYRRLYHNYKIRRLEVAAMRSTVRRVRAKIAAMENFRNQKGGAPRRPASDGGGTDYTALWLQKGMHDLKTARVPFSQDIDMYEPTVVREETAVAAMKKRVEGYKRRLDEQERLLEEARQYLAEERSKERDVQAQTEGIKPIAAEMSSVGVNLLKALPYSPYPPRTTPAARYNELRIDWGRLVRAFHEPIRGATYGGQGKGELPEFTAEELRRTSFLEEEVSKQVFDVAVVPNGYELDALRIVGRRWCSDPAFARELIRLSIDLAGLPPGTLKSQCYAASNIGRAWLLSVPAMAAPRAHTSPAEAQAALAQAAADRERQRARLQAFGICVEVAARRVRALLGNKRGIADMRSDVEADAPKRFEHCFPYDSNMIGWSIGIDQSRTDLKGMTANTAMYITGMREALLTMMMSMGREPELEDGIEVGGFRSDWARQTAATLATGGSSRQIVIVRSGDRNERDEVVCGDYGLGGQKQPNEFFEFDVEVKAPESEVALAEILRFEDPDRPVFVHLSPTVVHLSGPTRSLELLLQFLGGPHSVALCLLSGRYQVLFKDKRAGARSVPPEKGGTLVLIDPMAQKHVVLTAFTAIVEEASRSLGVVWTARRLIETYRDAGQDNGLAFLPALARALATALGVHRLVNHNQPLYPLLGWDDYDTYADRYEEGKKTYKPIADQASAVSDLKHGFGPFCLALAALAHNENTVPGLGPRTKRIELWA